jgi:hypothetical protein
VKSVGKEMVGALYEVLIVTNFGKNHLLPHTVNTLGQIVVLLPKTAFRRMQ